MKTIYFTVFLVFVFFVSSPAHKPQPTARPPTNDQNNNEEIIRISSQPVLIDAIVLDKSDNQVNIFYK